MQLNRLSVAMIALIAVCCLPTAASTPNQATKLVVGQPAPSLNFTDLLQAPVGAKTDWPSLRGKVVVLEFWATWCGGCIVEIPHLNDLIQSLSPDKVQFIAVDDEDPAVVKKFLTTMPINGWLGLDTTKQIIKAYQAQVRPLTVVVDTQGRIAGILNPSLLTKEQLVALAGGKSVSFPVNEMAAIRDEAFKQAKLAADSTATGTDGPKPLFDISIRPGDPAGKMMMVHRPSKKDDSYTYDALNLPLSLLLQNAAGIADSRLVIHADKGEKYSLHVSAPGGDLNDLAPAIQLAIVAASRRKLSHVSTMEEAYLLQTTPKAASLLTPAEGKMSFCFYQSGNGKLMMMKSTLDSLASSLEDALNVPVVNETGITGEFTANLDLPKGDFEAAKAALEKNLGLTLVKAQRSIERLVLDPLPVPEKTVDTFTPIEKPASTTEKHTSAAATLKP